MAISPKISVIVPIYNTEAFLVKCISSIQHQTFRDLEILCIDDCSPDSSYQIINERLSSDSRLRLIRHETNLGLGGARNTGIREAKGQFIASVDSDDHVNPAFIEDLYRAATENNADIVVGGYNRVNEDGDIISSYAPKSGLIKSNNESIDIFRSVNPSFWNKLWVSHLFEHPNVRFPNHLYYEDLATTPKLLHFSKRVFGIQNAHYNYLIHKKSITKSINDKHIFDYFRIFALLEQFLVDEKIMKTYQAQFIKEINFAMQFHSQNVLDAEIDENHKRSHLKMLALVKAGFCNFDFLTGDLSSDELLNILQDATIPLSRSRQWNLGAESNEKDITGHCCNQLESPTIKETILYKRFRRYILLGPLLRLAVKMEKI